MKKLSFLLSLLICFYAQSSCLEIYQSASAKANENQESWSTPRDLMALGAGTGAAGLAGTNLQKLSIRSAIKAIPIGEPTTKATWAVAKTTALGTAGVALLTGAVITLIAYAGGATSEAVNATQMSNAYQMLENIENAAYELDSIFVSGLIESKKCLSDEYLSEIAPKIDVLIAEMNTEQTFCPLLERNHIRGEIVEARALYSVAEMRTMVLRKLVAQYDEATFSLLSRNCQAFLNGHRPLNERRRR